MVIGSLFLARCSFDEIGAVRQLERVPRGTVNAVLEGEVNLQGQVVLVGDVLHSPDTGSGCAYYRYLIEVERRDGDGNTYWATESDTTSATAFRLQDATGSIRVVPAETIEFHVNRDHQRREGDRRYSEYRLDAGDRIFVFGYASGSPDNLSVEFTAEGHYTPIISQAGEASERRSMVTKSVMACWFALLLLSLAVLAACRSFKAHRVSTYLTWVTTALTFSLVFFGVRMMRSDLESAADRVSHMGKAAESAVHATLSVGGRTWDGDWASFGAGELPEDALARVTRIRIDLARTVERTNAFVGAFPERLFAGAWGIEQVAPIPVPDVDRDEVVRLDEAFQGSSVHRVLAWVLGVLGSLACVFMTMAGFRQIKQKRLIENVPTSKTAGLTYGLAELSGTVETIPMVGHLNGPVTSRPCVRYQHKVEQRRGSGKNARWVTVSNTTKYRAFLCRDDEGATAIDPREAEVITTHRTVQRVGRIRNTEWRIEVGDPLYALGSAELDPSDPGQLVLARGPRELPFVLSNRSEDEVMQKKAGKGLLLLNLAQNGLILVGLMAFGAAGQFAATDYLAAALLAPTYQAFLLTALMFNDLIFLRRRVDRAWANIDVSLKKRADLIPNLQEVVTGYLQHEKSLQSELASLRAGFEAGQFTPQSAGALVDLEIRVMAGVRAVVERYPDLAGDEVVGRLFDGLTRIEDEIALMRIGYNQSVERYNTRSAHFPEVILAKVFRFEERSFFGARESERVLPAV